MKSIQNKGDKRPVYGFFLALNVNPSTIAHFFVLRKTKVAYYGGEAKIIPIDVAMFIEMLNKAKKIGGIKSKNILDFIMGVDDSATRFSDENEWYADIRSAVASWLH